MILFIRKILAATIGKKATNDFFASYVAMTAGYVARNSVQLFLMICIALVLGFVSNYILIKLAGVANYGSYVYIFNLLYLLSAFCIAGADNLLTKKVAIYEGESKYPELKGVIAFSILLVVITTVIVSLVSKIIVDRTGIVASRSTINWLLLSFLSLLMLSVIAINQAALQGLRKVFLSQVTERLVRPLLLILLVLAFYFINGKIDLTRLIWLNVGTIAVAVLITFILLWRSIPSPAKNIAAKYETNVWMKAAMAFLFLDIFNIINSRIDVFLLGIYKTSEEVGVYNIALRISEITGFGLLIINFVIAPLIARLYANKEIQSLQNLVTRSARVVLTTGLPLSILIILFRRPILSFFGADILNGGFALLILCLGQLLNIICGSVGLLLIMTGNQKFSIISLFVGMLVNIGLNLLLVPEYGLGGTAIATASGLAAWNLLMYYFVRTKLSIRTTALGTL